LINLNYSVAIRLDDPEKKKSLERQAKAQGLTVLSEWGRLLTKGGGQRKKKHSPWGRKTAKSSDRKGGIGHHAAEDNTSVVL